jgi:hypothetical protein
MQQERGTMRHPRITGAAIAVTGQGVQNFFVATPGLAAGVSSTVPVSPSQSGTGY